MKTTKIVMFLAFMANAVSLFLLVQPLRELLGIVYSFNKPQVYLSLVVPSLQLIVTFTAFGFWRSLKKTEDQTIKYAKVLSFIFLILAPILFVFSYTIAAYFVFNLANPQMGPILDSPGIHQIKPSDIPQLPK